MVILYPVPILVDSIRFPMYVNMSENKVKSTAQEKLMAVVDNGSHTHSVLSSSRKYTEAKF